MLRMMKQTDKLFTEVKDSLLEIYSRDVPPDPFTIEVRVRGVCEVLANENPAVRPRDRNNMPGGLVLLRHDIDSIIIPDLHGRLFDFLSILFYQSGNGASNLRNLVDGRVQIVCLGDGMHGEGRASQRWGQAYREFLKGYKNHEFMDEEMRESFGVMEAVMELKRACPDNFHFLKGNHENIRNESGDGNHAFMKYAFEGQMVAFYVKKFYGIDFEEDYYRFEKNLPLIAAGRDFLASHAEPATFFDRERVVNYRYDPEVVEGLTWTADGQSEEGSVMLMLEEYIDEKNLEKSLYFGGHRAVLGKYSLRASGKYVQIHNPEKCLMLVVKNEKDINPDEDVIEIAEAPFLYDIDELSLEA